VSHVLFERVIDVSGENNINSAFSIGGGNQCHEKTTEFQQVIDFTKQKYNTLCVGHHFIQTNIYNVNKT
jgi:hypothetical protein